MHANVVNCKLSVHVAMMVPHIILWEVMIDNQIKKITIWDKCHQHPGLYMFVFLIRKIFMIFKATLPKDLSTLLNKILFSSKGPPSGF